ncbi:hypothetical protein HZA97_00750 [Candidatus Woesearchaeota archaeon]|nr:hypothetical protein [Candidatus Woesearchaeota archaeon]
MDLNKKLENYFTGRKSKLEYDLLREITEELFDDEKTKKRELDKIYLYENREIFFGKTFPNISTFSSVLYVFLTNNWSAIGMTVVISEGARNFLDYYFTKNRRKKISNASEKLKKKKELSQKIYTPEEKDKDNEYKNEEDYRIDPSGYSGWLNPNEEDPK